MTNPPGTPEIAAAYDRWARTYDSDLNLTRDMASVIIRQLNWQLAGYDVIEIGCGTGRNTQWLAERARSVIAMDLSAAMLLEAKTRVDSSKVRFLQHDIRSDWPVAASLDFTVGTLVLEHVENLQPTLAEAGRALRTGGELFLCELHPTRQMIGRQAEFTDAQSGKSERIPTYLHDISEYVNTALNVGFRLMRMDEWRDSHAMRSETPRLLSLHFRLDRALTV